jgi:hypothetical protein
MEILMSGPVVDFSLPKTTEQRKKIEEKLQELDRLIKQTTKTPSFDRLQHMQD